MRPAVGSVKPPIMRRQVVLPEPDGPSSVKNSPASIVRSTPSTARTAPAPLPKTQDTWSSVTAAVMTRPSRTGPSARRTAPSPQRRSTTSKNGDVVRHPAVVGNTPGALALARRHRRAPEVDLVERVVALARAALVGEQLVALARGRHRRHRAEPRRQVALQLGIDRVLEPHVRAVRVLGFGVHHRG